MHGNYSINSALSKFYWRIKIKRLLHYVGAGIIDSRVTTMAAKRYIVMVNIPTGYYRMIALHKKVLG